jgi:hypothetical protein
MPRSIERRSSPRNQLSRLVHVRPPETSLAPIEVLRPTCALTSPPATLLTSALANFSLDSIYFLMESLRIRKHMQLFVSFPNEFNPSAIRREYMVEVMRHEPLHRGRCVVAAKLLENIQLRLRDGLLVPETGFWSQWPLVVPTRLNVYA